MESQAGQERSEDFQELSCSKPPLEKRITEETKESFLSIPKGPTFVHRKFSSVIVESSLSRNPVIAEVSSEEGSRLSDWIKEGSIHEELLPLSAGRLPLSAGRLPIEGHGQPKKVVFAFQQSRSASRCRDLSVPTKAT